MAWCADAPAPALVFDDGPVISELVLTLRAPAHSSAFALVFMRLFPGGFGLWFGSCFWVHVLISGHCCLLGGCFGLMLLSSSRFYRGIRYVMLAFPPLFSTTALWTVWDFFGAHVLTHAYTHMQGGVRAWGGGAQHGRFFCRPRVTPNGPIGPTDGPTAQRQRGWHGGLGGDLEGIELAPTRVQ